MMIWLVLAATAFSVGLLTMLGLGDPKRRRAAGLHGGHGQPMRHLYVVGAIVPGVIIAYTGDAAMWLIWFGGCAVGMDRGALARPVGCRAVIAAADAFDRWDGLRC